MKVKVLLSTLMLLGVLSSIEAINVKSQKGPYQSVRQETTLAQTASGVMTDTSAMKKTNIFIIDDLIAAFWCRLVGCDMKPPPPKQDAPKQQKVETAKVEKKEEKKNDT